MPETNEAPIGNQEQRSAPPPVPPSETGPIQEAVDRAATERALHDEEDQQRTTDDETSEPRPKQEGFSQTIPMPDKGPIGLPAPTDPDENPAQPGQPRPELSPAPTTPERRGIPENAETARRLAREPVVARLVGATQDPESLNPDKAYSEDEAKETADQASSKTPEDLPTEAIKRQSEKARASNTDTVDTWATGVEKWAKNAVEGEDATNQTAKETLKSLGIDTTGDNIHGDIKDFYANYLNGESDIEGFAKTLAQGCKDTNGNIDLNKLDQRMESIKELFNAFGKDNDINLLVKDYAISHALLDEASQDQDVRGQIAAGVKDTIKTPVTDPSERARLQPLHEAQGEISKEKKFADDVEEVINGVRDETLPSNVLDDLMKQQDEINKKFQRGDMTKDERDEGLDKLKDMSKGLMTFGDKFGPEEGDQQAAFRKALEKLGVEPQQIENWVRHEQAHFLAAEQMDLAPQYAIQLVNKPDGTPDNPRVSTRYNDIEGTGDEIRAKTDAILIAPGFDDLSRHDIEGLGIDKEDIAAAKAAGATESTAILAAARENNKKKNAPATGDATDGTPDTNGAAPATPDSESDAGEANGDRPKTEPESPKIVPIGSEDQLRSFLKTNGQDDQQIEGLLAQARPAFEQLASAGKEPAYVLTETVRKNGQGEDETVHRIIPMPKEALEPDEQPSS